MLSLERGGGRGWYKYEKSKVEDYFIHANVSPIPGSCVRPVQRYSPKVKEPLCPQWLV